MGSPAFIFDLDGTLIDNVCQRVIAWRAAHADELGVRQRPQIDDSSRHGCANLTMTDSSPVASRLGYGISDADQHVYESAETTIEYLDPE